MSDVCGDTTTRIKARTLTNAGDSIGSITSNIDAAIASIENSTDCDAIKAALSITGNELEQLVAGVTSQIEQLAQKFLPIVKLPGSFKKILGWAKKLVTGMIAPQLEAYIRLTQQLIKLAQATNRLMQTIDQVIPRLEQCAIDAVNEQIYGLRSEIDTTINSVILSISNSINTELCDLGPSLTALGATLNDSVINTQQVVLAGRSIAEQADASIAATLNTISTIGSSLQQIAPITFNIDTSSAEAFNESIAAGAFDEFQQSVDDFVSLVLPTNTSPPTVTGTAQLGETLTVSTGTWEGDPTFSYQWYRNEVPIVGANQATYVLGAADGNQSVITVEVTGTNQNGDDIAEPSPITTTFVTGGLFSFGQRV